MAIIKQLFPDTASTAKVLLPDTATTYKQKVDDGDFLIQQIVGHDFGKYSDTKDFYIQPVPLDNTYAQIMTNSKTMVGAYATSSNYGYNDDVSLTLEFINDHTIRLTRASTGYNTNMFYGIQIISYIGEAGGPNEFIVRQRGIHDMASGTASGNETISGISNLDNVVPVVVAQYNTGTNPSHQQLETRLKMTSSTNMLLERTDGTSNTKTTYAIVEYTGSNWSIGHSYLDGITPGSWNDLPLYSDHAMTTTMSQPAWDKAFWEFSFKSGNHTGLTSNCIAVRGTNVDKGICYVDSAAVNMASAGIGYHSIYNPGFTVQHLTPADPGTDNNYYVNITAVADPSKTSVHYSMNTTGTGTAYPRWGRRASLYGTDKVWIRNNYAGNSLITGLVVCEWE